MEKDKEKQKISDEDKGNDNEKEYKCCVCGIDLKKEAKANHFIILWYDTYTGRVVNEEIESGLYKILNRPFFSRDVRGNIEIHEDSVIGISGINEEKIDEESDRRECCDECANMLIDEENTNWRQILSETISEMKKDKSTENIFKNDKNIK